MFGARGIATIGASSAVQLCDVSRFLDGPEKHRQTLKSVTSFLVLLSCIFVRQEWQ